MLHGGNIKTNQLGISEHRFHLFNIFLYMPNPETVEPEFIHRFKHIGMNKITLETNMIIMADEIGFAGQHFHQKMLALNQAIRSQIDQGIYTGMLQ